MATPSELQPSVTKSDIDNLVSRITDNEDLVKYLAGQVDNLKTKIEINKLIAKLSKSDIYCDDCGSESHVYKCKICGSIYDEDDEENSEVCGCEGIDNEDTLEVISTLTRDIECTMCGGIYPYINSNADIAEILKIFTNNFTYNLRETFSYNDGCKYLDMYIYTFKFDDNLSLSYDFKRDCKKDYIKNRITNTSYALDKRTQKYSDCYSRKSMLLNNNWDSSNYVNGLDKHIDPKLFNTTAVWKYTTEKYSNIPPEKIAFLLLELVYLLMDRFMEAPCDD